MAKATNRLERYLEDELGECRSEDVDRRLEELTALEAERLDTELDVGAVGPDVEIRDWDLDDPSGGR